MQKSSRANLQPQREIEATKEPILSFEASRRPRSHGREAQDLTTNQARLGSRATRFLTRDFKLPERDHDLDQVLRIVGVLCRYQLESGPYLRLEAYDPGSDETGFLIFAGKDEVGENDGSAWTPIKDIERLGYRLLGATVAANHLRLHFRLA